MSDSMKALVSEGNFREVRCDPSTHALTFIDYPHYEAHSGKMFSVMYSVADIGAETTPNETIQLSLTVPESDARMHMLWFASVGGAGRLLVTRNPTGGLENPSAVIVPANHKEDSGNVSILSTVALNATVPTGGSVPRDEYFGITGVGGRLSAGESRGVFERILNPGDVLSLQLICSENVYGVLELTWYEHTDKETIE